MRRSLRWILAMGCALLPACGGGGGNNNGGNTGCGGIACPNQTTVTITISPSSLPLNVGESGSLSVQIVGGSPSPTLRECTSSSVAVATTFASNGSCRVTAVAAGNATITAFTTAGQQASAAVVVATPPPVVISLTPASLPLNVGETGNISVQVSGGAPIPTLERCTSSNVDVATAAAAGSACRVVAVAAGTSTITARVTSGDERTAIVSVTPLPPALGTLIVTPASGSITVGQRLSLVPNANPAASSVGITYAYSSTPSVIASVSQSGEVTGLVPGDAVITVTATGSGTGYTTVTRTATAAIVVSPAPPAFDTLLVSPANANIAVGQTIQLVSTVQPARAGATVSFQYQTNTPGVATVSPSGLITAVAPGSASITVIANGSGTALTPATRTRTVQVAVSVAPPALKGPLTVTPASLTMLTGQTTTLTSNANAADASVQVTYTYQSTLPSIASATVNGAVTAVAPGVGGILVTAVGVGSGFTTTTLTAVVPVSVANPCPVVDRTLDITALSGTITSGDCLRGSVARVDYSRVTTGANRVLQLTATASFTPVSVVALTDTTAPGIVTSGANTASGAYFLPAGTAILAVESPNGVAGTYSFSAATQLEDVNACRWVTVLGTLTTQQQLTQNSCAIFGNRFDQFLLFAPGRSCSVEMRTTGAAGWIVDPYLQVYNAVGSAEYTSNDNINGSTRDARVTLSDCRDSDGSYLQFRAQAVSSADFGSYTLVITLGAPAPRAAGAR